MVDHTLTRFLKLKSEELSAMADTCANFHGVFYVKMGMDGASSQSKYNQRYEETDLREGAANEESLFLT